MLPSVGFFVVRKHLGNVFWAPLSGAMWTAGRDGSSQWRTRRQQRGAQRVGTQRRLLQGRSESIHPRGSVREDPSKRIREDPRGSVREDPSERIRPRGSVREDPRGAVREDPSERIRRGGSVREDPSETIRPRGSAREDPRARARGTQVELRWNSGGTQVGGSEAGQRRVRGGTEWESDGSRVEVGWKSDGSRMEVGWSARGTQVELRWNSGGRARGGSEAGQRRVHCRSLQIPLPPCRFPLILKQGEVSRVKLAG